MNEHLRFLSDLRIERTVQALRSNGMDAHRVENREELIKKIKEYVPEGSTVGSGGSVTLSETGVVSLLRSGAYTYFDRFAGIVSDAKLVASKAELYTEENRDISRKALTCDVYFTSSNAITENGELFNVDGTGNRVAALTFGPKKVIVVAGENKIVKDIEAARRRVKEIACPANARRLSVAVPCAANGLCNECRSPHHCCCHEVVTQKQICTDRITVLILPESYGL